MIGKSGRVVEDTRYETTLTPVRGERWYGAALAALAGTAVLVPFAYFVGPTATTTASCRGTNPFDRFGLWLAQGAHVDGPAGAPSCIIPHPLTWVVVVTIAATGLGLIILALRRH